MMVIFAIIFHATFLIILIDSIKRARGGIHGFVRMILFGVNVVMLLITLAELFTQMGVPIGGLLK